MAINVPTTDKVKNTAVTGLKAGGLGGAAYGLGKSMFGSLGGAGGAVLAGAALGGTDGKIVSINGVMELVAKLFSGGL